MHRWIVLKVSKQLTVVAGKTVHQCTQERSAQRPHSCCLVDAHGGCTPNPIGNNPMLAAPKIPSALM